MATFDRLLGVHRDALYSHALYVLRDADDAQDVVQEAFLRMWRQGADVPEERIKAWLLRVVHNLCLDQIRRRQVRRGGRGETDAPDVEAIAAAPEGWQRPDGRLLAEARRREVLQALATLSPQTRSLVLMHYFQGMKMRDIAQLLDRNLNSVKVQIHRARKALRLVLAEPTAAPAAQREICR